MVPADGCRWVAARTGRIFPRGCSRRLDPPYVSFDHLVGAADERERDGEAERLGGRKVDDQLDLRGLLDRQGGRLLAGNNPARIKADLAISHHRLAPPAHHTPPR